MSIMTNPSVEKETANVFPIRLTGIAGLAAAAILFVNAAKRAGLIEISAATQLVAPLAQAFALILVVGLAAVALRQSSKYSSVALALNVLGLAAATGAEWVINLVFVGLDRAQISALRPAPQRTDLRTVEADEHQIDHPLHPGYVLGLPAATADAWVLDLGV